MSLRRAALVYLAAFAAFVAMYLPQPILPLLGAEFGVAPSQAGLLVSSLLLGIALLSLVVAPLSDRLGRKPMLVGCLLLLAVPTLLCAVTRSFELLVALRFLQGVFIPGVLTASVAYLTEEFRGRVPLAVGGYIAATVLGGMSSRLLAGAVSDGASWRWAFVLAAAFSALAGLALWRLLPGSSRFLASRDLASAYRGAARHLLEPALLGYFAVGFLLFFSFLGLFTFLPYHVAGPPYFFSPLMIGLLFLTYGAGALSSPLAGALAQRVPRRAILRFGLALGLFASLGTLLTATPLLIAALTVLCFANFTVQATATALVAEHASHDRAGANALYLFAYYLGGSLGGVLPGFALIAGGWPGVLAATGSSLALALVLTLRQNTGAASRPMDQK